MHQHKAIARIFLFLSIINFTLAGVALAQTSSMHEVGVDPVTATEADDATGADGELVERFGRPSTFGHLHSRLDDIVAPATENLDEKKFFSKEMFRKMKEYLVLGSVYGIFVGIANGVQKEISGTVAPGAQTVGGRSVKPLDEHPQYQEDPVSRSLSNIRDQDLKMLSVLSRRILNCID